MTYDYWNPLFGSVTAIPVSFLSPKAAERILEALSQTQTGLSLTAICDRTALKSTDSKRAN